MLPLIPNIEELEETYCFRTDDSIYDDELLNLYSRHCRFLSEYQTQIINDTGIALKEILYSLYYWGCRFIERSNEISFYDAGFEQYHFQIIEQIETSCGEVDFDLLEKIENNEV